MSDPNDPTRSRAGPRVPPVRRELCEADGFTQDEVAAIFAQLRRKPTEAEIEERLRAHEELMVSLRPAFLRHAEMMRKPVASDADRRLRASKK